MTARPADNDPTGSDAQTLAAVLRQHASLTKELAHHDAAIETMSEHIGRVDATVTTLAGDVRIGFAEIGKQLAKTEGQRGPSFGSVMGLVALGGTIVGMSAAAITFLVVAIVSPDITKLKERGESHHSALEQTDREMRDEYRDMKRAEQRRLYDRLDRFEQRMGWTARVDTEKR